MKKLALIIGAIACGAVVCAEPDSGAFVPSESFAASHIYLEANAGIVFPPYVFDASKTVTKTNGEFSFGAGYNWGGWLFGLEYTRDYFGEPKNNSNVEKLRDNVISFRLRRVLSQETIGALPAWLEIVPGMSAGVNIFTEKGVDATAAPLFRPSLELAFVPNTERAVPYIGFDYNLFINDKYFDGAVGYPRATVGFRLYPFGSAGAGKKVAAASVVTALEPAVDFTPDGDGVNDTVAIKPTVKKLKATPERWKVEVRDQQGETVQSWNGKGKVPSKIDWDGTTISGERLFSSETYTVVTTVVPAASDRERLGQSELQGTSEVKTGVLMEEIVPQKQWKIVVNTIYFDANAATFDALSEQQKQANRETLDSIARQTLALSDDIKIEVQGYANNVSNTQEENLNELIPLSRSRAEAIKEQLKSRGLKDKNLTALGMGGANPLAAWEDKAHWWKNRRVEFIVTK